MYKEHFALDKALFSDGIVRDGDVFFGPRQQLVAANLKIALSTRDSVAVLSGPMGVGKTTLASHAVRAATTRLALGWLGSAPLTPHELLEQLLSEFDMSPYKSSRVERMQNWRQFLGEMSITDTRVCVLVENAQEFEPEVMRHLGALTAADPNGCPGANIVLTCPTLPRELLNSPGLEPIKQRVRLSCRLGPLGVADIKAYLSHRAELAGSSFERIFAPDTDRMLYHYSEGIIRVVNNLCESALTVAATRKEALLTPELVMRVAVGLFGMEPTQSLIAAAKPGPDRQAAAPVDAKPSAPIVGAAAIAAARMMAEEAEVATKAEQADLPQIQEPAAAPVGVQPEAVSDEGSMPTEEDSTLPVDANDGLDSHGFSDPASEPDDFAADDELIEDIAAESLQIEIASIPLPIESVEPETAQDLEVEPADSASVIEFVSGEESVDPFEFDEQTITDAVDGPFVVDDLDLPILTDSVEADDNDDVALAMRASSDEREPSLEADTALASTLAAYEAPLVVGPDADNSEPQQADAVSEAEQQKHDALEAFAHAQALEDISNSMAETLFGDADLAHLSATLAVATGESESVDDDGLSLELDDEAPPARSQAL
jgi:type II secretory pathway predicted ATPase ExeA